MSRKRKKKSHSTNLAAEFFVASQLNRYGYTVTLTLGNTKEIDLIVANPNRKEDFVTVDVKGLKNKTNWPVARKRGRANHFFILVAYVDEFNNLARFPEVYVVPSLHMRKPLLGNWSSKKQHKMKQTCVGYSNIKKHRKYKDAWHLLFKKR